MEVPGLGVELELQMPTYTTATQDPNRICDPHHSSRKHQIFNLLGEARDRTSSSWILVRFVTAETQQELLIHQKKIQKKITATCLILTAHTKKEASDFLFLSFLFPSGFSLSNDALNIFRAFFDIH